MHFTSVLAVSATLLALGYAAEPLAFNSWPADIQAGKPVTLTWSGADPHKPVTLTLKKGTSGNLDDVEIITSDAKDGKFTWTPGDNVKDGNFAFQVTQDDQKNYSALLKAGPAPDNNQSSSETTAPATTASATQATQATDSATQATESATQSTLATTISKALITSSSAANPSSSAASSSIASSSASAAGPFMTNTGVLSGKEATTTGGMQNGVAALPRYSTELALGAVAAFLYFGF